MKKQILYSTILAFTFVQSCNFGTINSNNTNGNNKLNNLPIEKVDYTKIQKKEPEKLTFSTKATIQNLTNIFKLPEGKNTKIELTTEKDNENEKIRIPKTGEFKVIFEKGSKFKIVDGNATDGEAIVEMPESVMEGFLRLTDEGESKSINKITVEDKLYYNKQELSVLNPKNEKDDKFKTKDSKEDNNKKDEKEDEKEKWYKLGKKPFPVPNDWYSDDGNRYILRFNNNGIKKLEFRWYKTDKADFPAGINEITPEAGGVVELAGVGKMEVPAGAVSQKTVMVMKEEKEAPEILYTLDNFTEPSSNLNQRQYDFISPVAKFYPFGLTLNKKATVFLETDKTRLGNNSPVVIEWKKSLDKNKWIRINHKNGENLSPEDFKADTPTEITDLNYLAKFIKANIKSTDQFDAVDTNNIQLLDKTNIPSKNSTNSEESPENNNFSIVNFKIKVNPAAPDPNQVINGEFRLYFNKLSLLLNEDLKIYNTTSNSIKTIKELVRVRTGSRLVNSYERYLEDLKNHDGFYKESITKNDNGKIKVELLNSPQYDPINDSIELDELGISAVEHELFHKFQYNFLGGFDNFIKIPAWLKEGTASYIGAYVIRSYYNGDQTDFYKTRKYTSDYQGQVKTELDRLSQSGSLITELEDPYSEGFSFNYEPGYFTYLANVKASDTQLIYNVPLITMRAMKNPELFRFHDYALHALYNDMFNLYPIVNISELAIKKLNISILNTHNSPIKEPFKLKTTSMKYIKLHTTEGKLADGKTLIGVKVVPSSENSDCLNNTKIQILAYNNKNTDITNPSFRKSYSLTNMKGTIAKDGIYKGKYIGGFACFKFNSTNDYLYIIISNTTDKNINKETKINECNYKFYSESVCKECTFF